MELEPEQNRSEAQSEQEWELSDLELDRSGFGRATVRPGSCALTFSCSQSIWHHQSPPPPQIHAGSI
jgi:hypothetical protein